VGKKSKRLFGKRNMVDEGTLTTIYGLGKELLDKRMEEVVVPKIDKILQAFVFMDSKDV
jgi:hypothetical protein